MPEKKKVVFESKQKVTMTSTGRSGVDSVSLVKEQKLTVTGDFALPIPVTRLGKLCDKKIGSVGPAKKPEKKTDKPKKEDAGKQKKVRKTPQKKS